MCAAAMGVPVEEEYLPDRRGHPRRGGGHRAGATGTLDELAERLQACLGPEVPVKVVRRRPATDAAGRVAVVGGGGADREALEAALERGCQTYVTGGVLHPLGRGVPGARRDGGVAVIDGTHYGTEKPPQLAMVEWFRTLGLDAEFIPDGPK